MNKNVHQPPNPQTGKPTNPQTNSPEVCIIGAGPSGATASLFLAKAGIPHLILDAAKFPRDKICGDGLDLKVFRVLEQWQPGITASEILDNQQFINAWGVRLITPNGHQTDLVYKPKPGEPQHPLFRVAKRLHFDDFLVKKIDPGFADFRQETEVLEIFREQNGWKIFAKNGGNSLEINTKLILAADGDHSAMLRFLGERKIERRHYAGSVRQYWKGVSGIHPDNLIEVYFPKSLPMSYFYIFPLPGGEANVGFGMVSEVVARKKINLRAAFAEILKSDPAMAARFSGAEPLEPAKGWGIPLASRRRKNFGDGYLLLGDAASLVCPTSGEGIGTGMMSGLIAAKFVENALAQSRFDADFFKNYDREVYRRLRAEILTYRFLMGFMPWRVYQTMLNYLIPSGLYRSSFENGCGKWLDTAYRRAIEVNP